MVVILIPAIQAGNIDGNILKQGMLRKELKRSLYPHILCSKLGYKLNIQSAGKLIFGGNQTTDGGR